MRLLRIPSKLEDGELPDVGLIVFEDDPISGPAVQAMLQGSARVQVARMPFATQSEDPLALVATAAGTITPFQPPVLIAVACTTIAMRYGPDRILSAVSLSSGVTKASDPMQAASAALRSMGISRIGIVCPYARGLAEQVAAAVEEGDTKVGTLSYMDVGNSVIPKVSCQSIATAARAAAVGNEAVFVSCTGLNATPLIAALEEELAIPVITSLQALTWDIARQLSLPLNGPGRLFLHQTA